MQKPVVLRRVVGHPAQSASTCVMMLISVFCGALCLASIEAGVSASSCRVLSACSVILRAPLLHSICLAVCRLAIAVCQPCDGMFCVHGCQGLSRVRLLLSGMPSLGLLLGCNLSCSSLVGLL